MKRSLIVLAASAGLTPTAQADVPRYDPAAYCRTVAETVGGSAQIERSCIQQEQQAYDSLKRNWPSLPDRATAYCDTVADAVGGTYQILATCIEQETEAADNQPNFRF